MWVIPLGIVKTRLCHKNMCNFIYYFSLWTFRTFWKKQSKKNNTSQTNYNRLYTSLSIILSLALFLFYLLGSVWTVYYWFFFLFQSTSKVSLKKEKIKYHSIVKTEAIKHEINCNYRWFYNVTTIIIFITVMVIVIIIAV